MKKKRTQSGFTLIEVMVAIGLMTVGSLGILSMQSATMKANRTARQLTTAQNISQSWLDRLERAALEWTTEGQLSVTGVPYFDNLRLQTDTTGWFRPQSAVSTERNMFEWDGSDTKLVTSYDDARYCTHVRLTWFNVGSSVRADVRTIFIREGLSSAAGAVSGDKLKTATCYGANSAPPDPTANALDVTAIPNLRSVHVSKILRFSPR